MKHMVENYTWYLKRRGWNGQPCHSVLTLAEATGTSSFTGHTQMVPARSPTAMCFEVGENSSPQQAIWNPRTTPSTLPPSRENIVVCAPSTLPEQVEPTGTYVRTSSTHIHPYDVVMVYACMCVCIYACMCVCMCTRTCMCTCTCVCACVCACMCACACVRVQVCGCICVCPSIPELLSRCSVTWLSVVNPHTKRVLCGSSQARRT